MIHLGCIWLGPAWKIRGSFYSAASMLIHLSTLPSSPLPFRPFLFCWGLILPDHKTPPNLFVQFFLSDGNEVYHFFWDGTVGGWMWRIETSLRRRSLHWIEITSPVGGCKTQRSAGRHRAGLTGLLSNLAIVSEGLFFGLLSHYAVMVAIFCLGIWLFHGGNKCQNVFELGIYHL